MRLVIASLIAATSLLGAACSNGAASTASIGQPFSSCVQGTKSQTFVRCEKTQSSLDCAG